MVNCDEHHFMQLFPLHSALSNAGNHLFKRASNRFLHSDIRALEIESAYLGFSERYGQKPNKCDRERNECFLVIAEAAKY